MSSQAAQVAPFLWFTRDLRLGDHPALTVAAQHGPLTTLFVLGDVLLQTAGLARTAYLHRTIRVLDSGLRSHDGAVRSRASPRHRRRLTHLRGYWRPVCRFPTSMAFDTLHTRFAARNAARAAAANGEPAGLPADEQAEARVVAGVTPS